MNQNYVRIGGGLTKDPHYATTRHDSQMVGLTVAVNGARYDGATRQQVVTTEYISVIAFGTVAEQIVELGLGRGDTIVVEGELSQQEIEDADGKKDRKTRVQAWSVRVVSSRQERQRQPGPPPPTAEPDPWSQTGPTAPQPGNWGPAPTYDEPPF